MGRYTWLIYVKLQLLMIGKAYSKFHWCTASKHCPKTRLNLLLLWNSQLLKYSNFIKCSTFTHWSIFPCLSNRVITSMSQSMINYAIKNKTIYIVKKKLKTNPANPMKKKDSVSKNHRMITPCSHNPLILYLPKLSIFHSGYPALCVDNRRIHDQ